MGEEKKKGPLRWFLGKVVTAPATYIGLAVALAVGRACLGVDVPMGGAIGLGTLVGLAAGAISFLAMFGIKSSHRIAMEQRVTAKNEEGEQSLLENLRRSGQSEDADLIEKILGDREAIRKQSRERSENVDAAHTLGLTSAIAKECCKLAEELQDLVRRTEDPLLESPDRTEEDIETIREDLTKAYQAVADARSRLRRGETLAEADFLSDGEERASRPLSRLTSQLEEETAISRRIEERISPEYRSAIVLDEQGDSPEVGMRKSESD